MHARAGGRDAPTIPGDGVWSHEAVLGGQGLETKPTSLPSGGGSHHCQHPQACLQCLYPTLATFQPCLGIVLLAHQHGLSSRTGH